ncbi:hypothetical protein H4R33_003623 [Dimargaris cristalligena]|nr:hypothetical protein H4R33_003623 [Dimargaris cristalligena]
MKPSVASVSVLGLVMALYVASRPQLPVTDPNTIKQTPNSVAVDGDLLFDATSDGFDEREADNTDIDDQVLNAAHWSQSNGATEFQTGLDTEQPPLDERSGPGRAENAPARDIQQFTFAPNHLIASQPLAKEAVVGSNVGLSGNDLSRPQFSEESLNRP